MKPKKILVVDDDAATQEFFSDVLKSAGYEVLTAGAAVTAVNLARVEEPDLITLDIELSLNSPPGAWDGFSVVGMLRRINTGKPPAVVIISGSPEPEKAIHKAAEVGIHTYLAKPVEAETLLKVVAEALQANPPA